MYFKYIASIFVSVLLLVNIGCSRFFSKPEEDQKKIPVLETQTKKECSKEVKEQISKYFSSEDETNSNELEKASGCLTKWIDDFKRDVKLNSRNAYSVKDLKKFVEKYFTKEPINDDFVGEAMELKKALIGGSNEEWTPEELENVKDIIENVKDGLKELAPYKQMLLFHLKMDIQNSADLEKLNIGIDVLTSVGKKLISHLKLNTANYGLSQLQRFITTLLQEANVTDEKHPLHLIEDYLELAENIKILLLGQWQEGHQSNTVLTSEWEYVCKILKTAIIYFGNLRKSSPLTADLPVFEYWVNGIFDLLNQSLSLKKSAEFSMVEINKVIDLLQSKKLYYLIVSPEAFKTTLPVIVSRFLDASRNPTVSSVNGQHIEALHKEFDGFFSVSKNILKIANTHFSELNQLQAEELAQSFSLQDLKYKLSDFHINTDDGFQRYSWTQLIELVGSNNYLTWDLRNHVIIGSAQDRISVRDLLYTNIYRSVAQIIIRGLTDDSQRQLNPTMMTVDELRLGYKLFDVLGKDIKAFDKRSVDSSGRTAKEADLFTYSANGDGQIQLQEFIEELALLVGGGHYFVHDIVQLASAEGCQMSKMDYFEKPYLKMDCTKRVIYDHAPSLFKHFPVLTKEISNKGKAYFEQLFDQIISVSKICPERKDVLETSDLRSFSMILSYIESLFYSYDRDKNDLLDEHEVREAANRFAKIIIDVAKVRVNKAHPQIYSLIGEDNEVWATYEPDIFEYIAFKGMIPGGMELGEQILAKKLSQVSKDSSKLSSVSVEGILGSLQGASIMGIMKLMNNNTNFNEIDKTPIDRLQLAQIFATLKSVLSKTPATCSPL